MTSRDPRASRSSLRRSRHGRACFAKWRAVFHVTDAMPSFTGVNANAHAGAHCAAFCGGQRGLNRRASLNGGEHREVHRRNGRIEHNMIAVRPARYWNLSTVSELNAAPMTHGGNDGKGVD